MPKRDEKMNQFAHISLEGGEKEVYSISKLCTSLLQVWEGKALYLHVYVLIRNALIVSGFGSSEFTVGCVMTF